MTFVPGPILQWGLHVDMWRQQFSWLAPAMKSLSSIRAEGFFVALVPLLCWCISVEADIDLALVLFGVNSVNGLFKLAFHGPGPCWTSLEIKGIATEGSYGLPSGHALTGVRTVFVAPAVFLRTGLALSPRDQDCIGRPENDTKEPRES